MYFFVLHVYVLVGLYTRTMLCTKKEGLNYCLKIRRHYSDEENAGVVTQSTNDGGIDGVISEDKLGFNKIYIQAKCWEKSSTVSRPEIQKFVGALAGMGANKGLFITTSQFSKEATKYAKEQHIAKVVLVDGMRLAKLMIEHGVGVSPVYRYVVKRLDSDYFIPN